MDTYKLNFSLIRFLIPIAALLPTIFWMELEPANNPLARNSSPYPILDLIENGCHILTFTLLIFVVNKTKMHEVKSKTMLYTAIIFLACYYIFWVLYLSGHITPLLLLGMSTAPTLYYLFMSLYLRNYIALIPCIIFAVVHFGITFYNFILKPM